MRSVQTKCPIVFKLAGKVTAAVICLAILFISFCQFVVLCPAITDQHFDNNRSRRSYSRRVPGPWKEPLKKEKSGLQLMRGWWIKRAVLHSQLP